MKKPDITSITLTPNKVDARGSVKVSIAVTDKEIVFTKVTEYGGEIYSGQEVGVI